MGTHYLDPSLLKTLPLRLATEQDRYFDYCLEPYRPRRPWRDKYRSENLFWHSLLVGGQLEGFREPLEALQQHVGRDLTVWGVKWAGGKLWWELYYYDPQKESETATISSISRALEPWFQIEPQLAETVPYMMVSFDLFESTLESKRIPEFNLYLTGETAHAGRAYKVRKSHVELENTYRFMEPKKHIDDVLPLVKSSMFVDFAANKRLLGKVLIPELFACKKVCVSKKRTCDAIYFSGIDVEQLLWFFRRFQYPQPLVDFVANHQERFEHLFFDVGIDYLWDAEQGSVVYPKTSYYGTF